MHFSSLNVNETKGDKRNQLLNQFFCTTSLGLVQDVFDRRI